MKFRNSLFVLLLPIVFVACESVPTFYMKFDEVKYVNKFPKEKSVKEKDLQIVCDDISGCCDLSVADSILVGIFPEADYFWKAYSLKDNTFKMSLIRKGHGRNEFPYAPHSLMFFDWEGNPLLKLNIPFMVPNFGISGDGTIYLLRNNTEKEVILKYSNINSLLD